jgi:hypothetical protein
MSTIASCSKALNKNLYISEQNYSKTLSTHSGTYGTRVSIDPIKINTVTPTTNQASVTFKSNLSSIDEPSQVMRSQPLRGNSIKQLVNIKAHFAEPVDINDSLNTNEDCSQGIH